MFGCLKFSSIFLLLIFLLTSCTNNQHSKYLTPEMQSVSPVQSFSKSVQPPDILTRSIGIVPYPPKLKTINWNASIQPLITQMLKMKNITQGSMLLIEPIKNNTNGNLQVESTSNELRNALVSNETFILIPPQKIAKAKQTLGISLEDGLISRSKAIGLARYIGAQYMLYGNAYGDIKEPKIQILLMLVKTGEIIWSGNGVVQY